VIFNLWRGGYGGEGYARIVIVAIVIVVGDRGVVFVVGGIV
jgi:hypothetical protein